MPQILFKAALHTYGDGDGDGITKTASVVQCCIYIYITSFTVVRAASFYCISNYGSAVRKLLGPP